MPNLIGLGGYKASGKDASADRIVDRYDFVKLGMSDPINDVARDLNPVIPHLVHRRLWFSKTVHTPYADFLDEVCDGDYALAKENPEVRRFLRAIGGVGRSIDANLWVDRLAAATSYMLNAGEDVVITGIRFPVEAEMVRALGGKLWWVTRPGVEDTSDTDITENSIDSNMFDTVVVNDSSLESLWERVDSLVVSENGASVR